MVDRKIRNEIACLLQDFTAGLMTNEELDRGLPCCYKSDDHTARDIADMLTFNYEIVCPFEKPHYINHKGPIDRKGRRQLARIAMYLRTDLEHAEPKSRSSMVGIVMALLALAALPVMLATGLVCSVRQALQRWLDTPRADPNLADELWPFVSLDEYKEALKRPKLLCGQRSL